MKKEHCFPLEVLKERRSTGFSLYDYIKKENALPDNFSRTDFLDFILSRKHFKRLAQTPSPSNYDEYSGLISIIRNVINNTVLIENLSWDNAGLIIAESNDMLCTTDTIIEWGNNSKQIYKIDSDFLTMLSYTSDILLSIDVINHLPFNDFYLDFSDAEFLKPFKGAFVHITRDNVSPKLTAYMIDDKRNSYSYYSNFNFVDGISNLQKDLGPVKNRDFSSFEIENGKFVKKENSNKDTRREVILTIFQIIMFLFAENKDVKESEITKKTYRPSSTVKDKFSEVKIWDVGFVYGKTIRAFLDNTKSEKEASKESSENRDTKTNRGPVRPHLRSAHWHRYHVGKGRKELRVNWILPVFVGGNTEAPARITKII